MLEYLHIRNLALIEDMELEFSSGMNVLTGETGAGKSFILKALGFLLGEKLKSDIVRPGTERAHVEALFTAVNPDGRELLLKRELLSSGRSRFYVNDELRTQNCARSFRDQLISYTSQHGQQKLLLPSFQDSLMEQTLPCTDSILQRDRLIEELEANVNKRRAIEERQAKLVEMRDLLEMQQQEIDKVNPQENEEEELENLRIQVRRIEEASKEYDAALSMLYGGSEGLGLIDLLQNFRRLIENMEDNDESIHSTIEAIEILTGELQQLSTKLRHPPVMEDMPEDMDRVEERLFTLSQLKRRLHRTLPQILSLKKEIEEKISFLDVCALDIRRLRCEENSLATKLKKTIADIIPIRRKCCQNFAEMLIQQLKGLGFSEDVRVMPEFFSVEIWPGITDEKVRILWAPNPGQPPQPLDRIASGGELSRFLLALSSVIPIAKQATYIFDEVDSGVGGLTLNRIADRLESLSDTHQLLLITHWPQIAIRADRHFQISKVVRNGQTYTLCSPLTREGRRAEIIRMAGGGKQGEALAAVLEQNTELTNS